MSTFIIGDIHGCFEEFRDLLFALGFRQGRDRVVCIGDLVDKGPESVDCVQYARSIGAEVILGNHEEKFVRYLRHELKKKDNPQYKNPMKFDEVKRKVFDELMKFGLVEWMTTFPTAISFSPFWHAVHGGFVPGIPFDQQDAKQMIRLRYVNVETGRMMSLTDDLKRPEGSVFWAERWEGPGNVFFGHTAGNLADVIETIDEGGNTFALDTGCVYGGKLTAAVMESFDRDARPTFVQVDAKGKYATYYEEES